VDFAAGLKSDRAVSVQLDLVLEVRSLLEPVRPEQEHGIDEVRSRERCSHAHRSVSHDKVWLRLLGDGTFISSDTERLVVSPDHAKSPVRETEF
jgi:hypothetical protein